MIVPDNECQNGSGMATFPITDEGAEQEKSKGKASIPSRHGLTSYWCGLSIPSGMLGFLGHGSSVIHGKYGRNE